MFLSFAVFDVSFIVVLGVEAGKNSQQEAPAVAGASGLI